MEKRVLFICRHNSGRSQMAEAILNREGGGRYAAESAGLSPRPVDPRVIAVMTDIGYDLSASRSKDVFSFYKEGRLFDLVITVCDQETESECPVFPGIVQRLHWPFDDPAEVRGTEEEQHDRIRKIRDAIHTRISQFIEHDGSTS